MQKTGIARMDAIIEESIELMNSDDRIVAAGFVGSMATGEFSEFSDFDMCVFTEDEDFEDMCGAMDGIAKKLSDYIIGGYYDFREDTEVGDAYWCYVTDKLTNFDFFIIPRSKAKPDHRFKGMVIIKDKDDFLAKIREKSSSMQPVKPVSQREFRFFLLTQRADFEYAAREFAKGERIEAIENVKFVFKQLLDFYERLQGIRVRDFRKLERILTEEERRLFDGIYSLRPTKSDLRRGQGLNWQLM
ncbi:MAG: nucleotidyltransferase domain-containing protein, partial [Thermoplasmata archaeon]